MDLYRGLTRSLLFQVDPETVHEKAMALLAKGVLAAPGLTGSGPIVRAMGIDFPNPVGLAAGFDKNAVALPHWHKLGFGFVEIGTVTRHSQPGNPKPRLFRLPEHRALINRLGFNNDGADAVAERIAGIDAGIPVGINLGKSKVTPLEEAHEDYAYSFQRLLRYGDYFAVNVSSPNTPGLRELQDAEPLRRILAAMREIDDRKPIAVKVAPDLEQSALDQLVAVCVEADVRALIATNTTVDRSDVRSEEPGGLSGEPLRERADRILAHLARTVPEGIDLIGVGGVVEPEDAVRKLELGAKLVQTYTGWVYGGPRFVPELLTAIRESKAP